MSVQEFTSAPTVQSCRLVGFGECKIIKSNPQQLMVTGLAPCLNMEVSLVPVAYVQCPEYWRIEVVGYLPNGICLTATKPYTVTIPLQGIIGSKGIEVVGANQSILLEATCGCNSFSADLMVG